MKRFGKYSAENQPKAWLFLLPSLVIIFLFSIYPLVRSFWMSFQSGTLLRPVFSGLDNYAFVLKDPNFHIAMKNTAIFAFAVVPIALLISLVVSWLIFEKNKA